MGTRFARCRVKEVVDKYGEMIFKAREEPKRTRKDVQAEANNKAAHTNNQLYSCGSLAPKLHKSANRVAGCSDCLVLRPTRQWEMSDGAVFLLGHLACAGVLPDPEVVAMLQKAVDATRHEIYVEHESLKTTVMKSFIKIVEAKDTRTFKRHYCNMFLECVVKWIGGGGAVRDWVT